MADATSGDCSFPGQRGRQGCNWEGDRNNRQPSPIDIGAQSADRSDSPILLVTPAPKGNRDIGEGLPKVDF